MSYFIYSFNYFTFPLLLYLDLFSGPLVRAFLLSKSVPHPSVSVPPRLLARDLSRFVSFPHPSTGVELRGPGYTLISSYTS